MEKIKIFLKNLIIPRLRSLCVFDIIPIHIGIYIHFVYDFKGMSEVFYGGKTADSTFYSSKGMDK